MKRILLIISLLFIQIINSQEITLKHNIGNTIIDQLYNFTCSGGGVDWARVFVLEDFGITGEYIIASGSFGIEEANTAPGDGVIVNVYAIDEGFPDSFDESLLLGSSALIDIPPTGNQIFTFNFESSIVITTDIEMILVEVSLGYQTQNVFMGGTMDSYDYSWFRAGCMGNPDTYENNYDINQPDLNYYITVTGENILAINDNKKDLISITPNPVFNKLFINVPLDFESSEIMVYNVNGQVILKNTLVKELDVSNFSSGLYFLKIKTPEGIISKKFVKQ